MTKEEYNILIKAIEEEKMTLNGKALPTPYVTTAFNNLKICVNILYKESKGDYKTNE